MQKLHLNLFILAINVSNIDQIHGPTKTTDHSKTS